MGLRWSKAVGSRFWVRIGTLSPGLVRLLLAGVGRQSLLRFPPVGMLVIEMVGWLSFAGAIVGWCAFLLCGWLPVLAFFGRIWGVLGIPFGRRGFVVLACRQWLCSFGGGTKRVVVLLRGHAGVVPSAGVVLG
ncbi:hypothetical protein M0R45_000269 [Rubus argutus]|uniref:Transmembrane protein n=1 Tax=Rubus argutus TaxID=59490 RepID=A0AAW1VLZ8_RUBAR